MTIYVKKFISRTSLKSKNSYQPYKPPPKPMEVLFTQDPNFLYAACLNKKDSSTTHPHVKMEMYG
jgi:hypothetical protein